MPLTLATRVASVGVNSVSRMWLEAGLLGLDAALAEASIRCHMPFGAEGIMVRRRSLAS